MKTAPFEFIKEVIVRSPIYPYQTDLSQDEIYHLINNDSFLESIYVASPLLYEETLKLRDGNIKSEKEREKIIRSLYRYYTRMCTRSTPFGLFSTCGVASWSSNPTSTNYPARSLYRHTRVDVEALFKFTTNFVNDPQIRQYLKFYPNNSLYSIGIEIRYIEYYYANKLRKYKISAITNNAFVEKILAVSKQGVTINYLENILIEDNISKNDAIGFIDNMIDSQLLISEFETSITNEQDYYNQVSNTFKKLNERENDTYIANLYKTWADIGDEINILDQEKINPIGRYRSIIKKLKSFEPSLEEGKLFHIDAFRTGGGQYINEKVKDKLLEALLFLKNLNTGATMYNEKLEKFKNKFFQRYEYKSVPLAEALDSDFGIGYPIDKTIFSAPVVDDIPFEGNNTDTQINLSFIDKWLLNILRDPKNKIASFIDLKKYKPPASADTDWSLVAPSLSAMFRIVNYEKNIIALDGFFGPSAAAILARFTHGNNEIKSISSEIATREDAMIDDCILAEFVHMPDSHISNIIMHPPVRKYEIPYLSNPSVTGDHILDLNDLYLKIQNNEIILFSKKLNKRIVPCKTHMHNHFTNTLPMYHFLSDLQINATRKSLNFSLASIMPLFNYLPRICYENIILFPASWSLPTEVFKIPANSSDEAIVDFCSEIRKDYDIPERVLYSEGDNELLVELTNINSIKIWLDLIKNKPNILLKEFLWADDAVTGQYINQYIASLVYNGDKKALLTGFEPFVYYNDEEVVARTLGIGSEWVYLKFYCGAGSADLLLTNVFLHIIQKITEQGLIKKCFFIKYVDPDYHIRLRVLLNDKADFNKVIEVINTSIAHSKYKQLILKVQPDVYVREIERYGNSTIELCESIFYIDSIITLQILSLFKDDQTRKALIGLKFVDQMLELFDLPLKNKMEIVDQFRKGFQLEFKSNKRTNEKVNLKYQNYKQAIREILEGTSDRYKGLDALLQYKAQILKPIIDELHAINEQNKLNVDFYNFIYSLLHMMLNRLITHKERIHEFVIYEFLFKYYTMQINLASASSGIEMPAEASHL